MNTPNPNLSINEKEYLFIEKYRPKNIDDITLIQPLKDKIKEYIKDGEIPNMLFSSKTPGLGKTSLCHVIISELKCEAMFINASMYPNIDTLRNKIKGFAHTGSFDGRPKIVILDEADFLNASSVQTALRGFIEEFSKNCRFILTCNYLDKIIEPIQNRLIKIDFDEMFKKNKQSLDKMMFLRTKDVLENENIQYNQEDLLYLIKHYYPSSRTILNKIQELTINKSLNIDKNAIDTDKITDNIISGINTKGVEGFNIYRKELSNLSDPSILFGLLYEQIDKYPQEKRPQIIITIAKYGAQDSSCRDRLVNAIACAVEVSQITHN